MGIRKNQFVHKALFAFTEVVTPPPPVPTPPPTPPAPPTPPTPPPVYKTLALRMKYKSSSGGIVVLGASRTSYERDMALTASELPFGVSYGSNYKELRDFPPGGIHSFTFRTGNGEPPFETDFINKLINRVDRVTINNTEVWKKGRSAMDSEYFVFDNIYPFDYKNTEILRFKIYFKDS